ncbi:MAG: DUF3332 domain-containing protein [Bacteroidaceae bacterium]|nr:DUF3332 domain-containing protein [Bacteroidaceae bacterium]
MKKFHLSVAALLMAGALVCSSCIGSFALFNKYEKWQCNMTGNKFVNGIVGLILQPIVAPICIAVDAIVLNTIEFWTGKAVMTASVQKVMGSDGRLYVIKTSQSGYEITDDQGNVTLFTHNDKNDSWSMTQNGVTRDLVRFNTNGTIEATMPSGATITVQPSEAGLEQARQAIYMDAAFAMR